VWLGLHKHCRKTKTLNYCHAQGGETETSSERTWGGGEKNKIKPEKYLNRGEIITTPKGKKKSPVKKRPQGPQVGVSKH